MTPDDDNLRRCDLLDRLALVLGILFALATAAVVCWGQVPPMPPDIVLPTPTTSTVTLAWDPSPDAGVGSYRVHYGTNSHSYQSVTNVGKVTSATITNLSIGKTYYFAATAVGTNQLESAFSNEIIYTVPSPAPAPVSVGLAKVVVVWLDLDGATSASGPWTNLASVPIIVRGKQAQGVFRTRLRTEMKEGVDW